MRKILITGTSSGLGDGLARYLSSRNHLVYGLSRKDNAKLRKCKSYHHVYADLTDRNAMQNALKPVLEANPEWDLIVLNAGVLGEIGDMHEVSTESMKSVMEINLWANKYLLDFLIKSNVKFHQLVAISSGAAVNGNRGWNAYSLSKAALNMMMQLYAQELPETHFSALAPGLVDTDMQAHIASLESDERFPSLDKLRAARGTDKMPRPLELAPKLLEAMDALKTKYPSGSFADIRSMEI
ncbi:MAG: SDR family NAD(P)-dependent oxidoreductase [Bacteroidales bacterium]|jgi:benzil reductase ((S)-benzoin forming)|nr:SDR family NAD(P)-dependent oxidoreductase [Bacteroidales bacterium]